MITDPEIAELSRTAATYDMFRVQLVALCDQALDDWRPLTLTSPLYLQISEIQGELNTLFYIVDRVACMYPDFDTFIEDNPATIASGQTRMKRFSQWSAINNAMNRIYKSSQRWRNRWFKLMELRGELL